MKTVDELMRLATAYGEAIAMKKMPGVMFAIDPTMAPEARLRSAIQEVVRDAGRLDHLQTTGSTVELLPGSSSATWLFRVGGLFASMNQSLRAAIDAAMKSKKETT